MSSKHMTNQLFHGDDEYYTLYEDVEKVIKDLDLASLFKDKIIYAPCDTEQSNIVKYLKDHKTDLQYKDLIYTSNDMYTNQDIFKEADIVFTNPPFKHYPRLLKYLNNMDKEFILWCPLNGAYLLPADKPAKIIYKPSFSFMRPDGSISYVTTFIISNIESIPEMKFKQEPFNYTLEEDLKNNNIDIVKTITYRKECVCHDKVLKTKYNINRIKFYPKDYYDLVAIPSSCYVKYKDRFDLIYGGSDIRVIREDDSATFVRYIVKLKEDYNKNNN